MSERRYALINGQITESQITDLGSYITDAVSDGKIYGRKDAAWAEIAATGEVNDLSAAVTWANIPIANVPTGTTGVTVSLGNHTHDSITDTNLLDKSATETVSGVYTFSANPVINVGANSSSTLTIGETTTARGNSQDSRILLYGENVGTIYGVQLSVFSSNMGLIGVGANPVTNLQMSINQQFLTGVGITTADDGTSAEWATAFGWGDHAVAGYLTSFTETNNLGVAVTWANIPIANVPTGTTGVTVSLGNHTHDGITDTNLLDKSAIETVSGNWTFSGDLDVVGTFTFGTITIDTADLAANAITLGKFGTGLEPIHVVATLPTLPDAGYPVDSVVILSSDSKLYRNKADVWVTAIATTDLTGTIDLGSQVSGTLTTAFAEAGLINANVTINPDGSLSGAGSGSPLLQSIGGAVDLGSQVSGALTTAFAAAGLINTNVLINADGSLTGGGTGQASLTSLPGQVQVGSIAANAVTAAEIAALTITSAEIAAGTITAAEIEALTITSAQIAANTITAGQIAGLTITAAEIAAITITAAKIVAGTITANEIAAGTITANEIAADTITSNNIKAATIQASDIAASTITGSLIAATTIAGANIVAGTITSVQITGSTLSAIYADLGSITAGNITIDTSGYIQGGQTAYDTGTGFFLGYDSTAYKFSLGDGTDFITWDGTSLVVRGNISLGNYTASNTLMLSADTVRTTTGVYIGSQEELKKFEINRPGTVRVTFNKKLDSVTGGVVNNGTWEIFVDGVSDSSGTISTDAYVAVSQDVTLLSTSVYITIEIGNGERNSAEPLVAQASIQNARVKADKSDGESVITD